MEARYWIALLHFRFWDAVADRPLMAIKRPPPLSFCKGFFALHVTAGFHVQKPASRSMNQNAATVPTP